MEHGISETLLCITPVLPESVKVGLDGGHGHFAEVRKRVSSHAKFMEAVTENQYSTRDTHVQASPITVMVIVMVSLSSTKMNFENH